MLTRTIRRSGKWNVRAVCPFVLLALGLGIGTVQAGPYTVKENFQGLSTFDDAALNGGGFFVPPDQGSAVGPNHYMEMVNLTYAVYNKDGSLAVPRSSLGTFFANAGVAGLDNRLSDPRLVFA